MDFAFAVSQSELISSKGLFALIFVALVLAIANIMKKRVLGKSNEWWLTSKESFAFAFLNVNRP